MTEADSSDVTDVAEDEQLTEQASAEEAAEASEQEQPKLSLEVQVESPSTCQRHVTVVVSRADVDRYLDREFDDLLPKAEVPGFRAGRAPRQLVVHRFKEHVNQQVKGKLLMDSLAQVTESEDFSPISEPDIDLEAIEVPAEGPLTFEFDLEVRPVFELPEWKGLSLQVPSPEVTEEDIDRHLQRLLQGQGKVVESDAPAEAGDELILNVDFSRDGHPLSRLEDLHVPLKPKLSLQDATIDNFGELLTGATRGETRQTEVTLGPEAAEESLAGAVVQATFHVQGINRNEPPRLTPSFLNEMGGFANEQDLRQAIREALERQHRYRANQRLRQQITRELTADARWELPPALLKRQAQRELRRVVMELQSAGFSNEMIQAQSNRLQQNIRFHTATALKEHFILERLAEEEKIEAEERDFDVEIALIAEQSGVPPRRVRARLEKRGEIDSLRNQIVERKVIELITSFASVSEVPRETEPDDTAAVDRAISGKPETAEIPEAKHGEEAGSLPK